MGKGQVVDIALFVLRIAIGVIFLAHGLQKLLGAFGGAGIDGTTHMMSGLGFTPPEVWAWILASAETVAGLFIILGIFPRLCATVIGIIMIVAITKVHGPKGFFMMQGGYEYQMMLLAVCISLILTGGGRYSLFDKF